MFVVRTQLSSVLHQMFSVLGHVGYGSRGPWVTWVIGHRWSRESRVMWVMGHVDHGSREQWVTWLWVTWITWVVTNDPSSAVCGLIMTLTNINLIIIIIIIIIIWGAFIACTRTALIHITPTSALTSGRPGRTTVWWRHGWRRVWLDVAVELCILQEIFARDVEVEKRRVDTVPTNTQQGLWTWCN